MSIDQPLKLPCEVPVSLLHKEVLNPMSLASAENPQSSKNRIYHDPAIMAIEQTSLLLPKQGNTRHTSSM